MKKAEFKVAMEKLLKDSGVFIEEVAQYDYDENQCGSTYYFRSGQWTIDIGEIKGEKEPS